MLLILWKEKVEVDHLKEIYHLIIYSFFLLIRRFLYIEKNISNQEDYYLFSIRVFMEIYQWGYFFKG